MCRCRLRRLISSRIRTRHICPGRFLLLPRQKRFWISRGGELSPKFPLRIFRLRSSTRMGMSTRNLRLLISRGCLLYRRLRHFRLRLCFLLRLLRKPRCWIHCCPIFPLRRLPHHLHPLVRSMTCTQKMATRFTPRPVSCRPRRMPNRKQRPTLCSVVVEVVSGRSISHATRHPTSPGPTRRPGILLPTLHVMQTRQKKMMMTTISSTCRSLVVEDPATRQDGLTAKVLRSRPEGKRSLLNVAPSFRCSPW